MTVLAVILAWVWLGAALGSGSIYKALVREHYGPIELGLIPLAVIASALLRSRLTDFTPAPWSNWWPATQLMVAAAVIGLIWCLGSVWAGSPPILSLVRIPGAFLTIAVAFAAATLHPRLMAALAGAIAVPVLFWIVAYLVPDELIRTIGTEISEGRTGRGYWYDTELSQTFSGTALYHLMRWVGFWGPASLLGASLLSFLLRRQALGHACLAGAVALFVGAGQFYLQNVGEGFGR